MLEKKTGLLILLSLFLTSTVLLLTSLSSNGDYNSNREAPPEERLLYMLFYQMSRMCRQKFAVKHDDRLDCLAQGVKYFIDALSISANEQIKLKNKKNG